MNAIEKSIHDLMTKLDDVAKNYAVLFKRSDDALDREFWRGKSEGMTKAVEMVRDYFEEMGLELPDLESLEVK